MEFPGIALFRNTTLQDQELIKKIMEGLLEMYDTGEVPARHIPARPDEDFDILVSELVLRYAEKLNKKNRVD